MPQSQAKNPSLIAAIDLGSNSFHMVVAKAQNGEIRILERLGEKVQLAAGIDEERKLTEESMQRGLDCLKRFAQLINGMPLGAVRIVGTNALREARNRNEFIVRAEEILGHTVEVISGREEARLIYLGVSHTLADTPGKRLVADIGGGSTVIISTFNKCGKFIGFVCCEVVYVTCVVRYYNFIHGIFLYCFVLFRECGYVDVESPG